MGAETSCLAGVASPPSNGDPRHSRRRQGRCGRQPRHQGKGLTDEIQTCRAALWTNARTRDDIPTRRSAMGERKSVMKGKSEPEGVDIGGRYIVKKKNKKNIEI